MRPSRLLPIAQVLVSAAAVAACGGSGPGWTYAPAPSITPPPSVEPSGDQSAAPSLVPSGDPSAPPDESPDPSASAGPSGDLAVIPLEAANILFTTDAISAPADQPFQIAFANNDAGVPHNVDIKDGTGAVVFNGETFPGVETRTYDVPALAAGEYQFLCIVHPTTMVGTLTVGG